MKWHNGTIAEAILSAKSKKKIFLVYVEGEDSVSQSVSSTYESSTVGNAVEKHCVPVKVSKESKEFKQFSEIYPVLVIPSSFLIGNDGIPLEVIGGAVAEEEFIAKINNAGQVHGSKFKSAPSASQGAPTTSDEGARTGSARVEPSNEGLDGENSDLTLEEKVERAKQLVDERRLKKMREEQEKEKEKELEHRRMGQEIQKAHRQKQEREMAEWAQQMKKEKEDARLARERVKAQIAQDKADRAARYGTPGGEAKQPERQPAADTELRQRPPPTPSDHTRIQFRLPNSTNRTHEFSSNAKLQEIFQFIDQTIQPGFSNYTLATTFSRCNYTRKDSSRSLTELELVPSAVLLIVPTTGAISAVSSSMNLWAFLSIFLSPFLLIWNIILSYVRRPTQPPAPPATSSPISEAASAQSRRPESGPSTSNPRSDKSPNSKTKNPSSYKRDGNVHRLANDSMDDDDENNTWNGNSTQQL